MIHVFEAEEVRCRQQHVCHRRAVGCLEVQIALQPSAGVAREEQRTAFVIVNVRVAHRRAVDHEARLSRSSSPSFVFFSFSSRYGIMLTRYRLIFVYSRIPCFFVLMM